jgi:hypothetical protein
LSAESEAVILQSLLDDAMREHAEVLKKIDALAEKVERLATPVADERIDTLIAEVKALRTAAQAMPAPQKIKASKSGRKINFTVTERDSSERIVAADITLQ